MLKEKWEIETIVETGTYLGDTTYWFADNFKYVNSIELNPEFLNKAMEKCKSKDIGFYLGYSVEYLPRIINNSQGRILFYLDSSPDFILGELKMIASSNIPPILVLHNYYDLEKISISLNRIYKEYTYYFNDKMVGDKIQTLYIEPKFE